MLMSHCELGEEMRNRSLTIFIVSLFLMSGFFLLMPGEVSAEFTVTVKQQEAGESIGFPDYDGDWIVFSYNTNRSNIYGKTDIWTYKMPPQGSASGTLARLTDTEDCSDPRITENKVYYRRGNLHDDSYGIYYQSANGGVELKCNLPEGAIVDYDAHGSTLVYLLGPSAVGPFSIHKYDTAGALDEELDIGEAMRTRIKIYRNLITWSESGDSDSDIFMYDLGSRTLTTICDEAGEQRNPDINANHVVWEDDRNCNMDIYRYTIGQGEMLVVDDAGDQTNPRVWQSTVVFEDEGSSADGKKDIVMYDWQNAKETKICTLAGDQYYPVRYDDQIVFKGPSSVKVHYLVGTAPSDLDEETGEPVQDANEPGTTYMAEELIDAEDGGKAELKDDSSNLIADIDLPPGALDADTTIKMETVSLAASPAGYHLVGNAVEFGPDGTTFDKSVTITLYFDAASLPDGFSEAGIDLYYFDEASSEWMALNGDVKLSGAKSTVAGKVDHFTKFAVMHKNTTASSDETDKGLSMMIYIGIIGAVVAAGAVALFFIMRKPAETISQQPPVNQPPVQQPPGQQSPAQMYQQQPVQQPVQPSQPPVQQPPPYQPAPYQPPPPGQTPPPF